MKKRILVLGSTGLIGHQVFNYLQCNGQYELYNFAYRKPLQNDTVILDARNEEKYLKKIGDIAPDFIVNCVGILINGANINPENAIFLNAYMPHRLARLADEINAKLIHISTDCVFSGNKGTPYIETDAKDGFGIYAKTKALGEVISEDHLTLRTSVVGPELKNDGEELFHWFMNQHGSIEGYTKAIWSGVTTIELAKAVKWAIDQNITGLYHVTNNTSISKFELLKLFKKYTQKEIDINSTDGKAVDKSLLDTRGEINYQIPSYEIMVSEMVESMKSNASLYPYKL
ncbi:SDR family oxidoreductase [Gammaproteobacteria bacterium]|nr:SDR family oxidoreductase [Gammaproteobacteria bacterium]